jgi:putative ABC transport system permease protein
MHHLWKDLRLSLRLFARNPGLASFAALAIALGIGSTTTMFSISHGLLRDLPFDQAERLVYLTRDRPSESQFDLELTDREVAEWRGQQTTLAGLAGFASSGLNLSGPEGRPERVPGARVTANAFELLRVGPAIGRAFLDAEETVGSQPVIILGHALWMNRYGGDLGIIGGTIRVNGRQRTVVGVMPEGFRFPYEEDAWIPLQLDPASVKGGEDRYIHGFGRLRDGVSLDEARAEFATLAGRLELAYPDLYRGVSTRVIAYKEHIVEREAVILMSVMVAVVFTVLLVACANVANLLLARAAVRSREVAVRSALGASRIRLVGQMLAEALVICALGGMLGVGLAQLGVLCFNAAVADVIPFFWMVVRIDPTVLAFSLGLVLLATVMAGSGPALKATGVNMNEVLKDASWGSSSLRLSRISRTLVVGEVALSCALLTVAGLMAKGVLVQTGGDLGFATEEVFTARVGLRSGDYREQREWELFYDELLARLEGLPGVRSAAISSTLPGLNAFRGRIEMEAVAYDRVQDMPRARLAIVSPGFFDALGVGLIEGRGFGSSDDAGAQPVAIVNQRFANRFFAGQSPLGKRIRYKLFDAQSDWVTIVGVAPNLGMHGRVEEGSEGVYIPYPQHPRRYMSILLWAGGDAMALTPAVRAEVAAMDPSLPIYEVNSLARRISEDTIPERTFATLFVIFGLTGLLLAAVGLYGVLAFAVRRRTKEIGIRMALGADAGSVLWLSWKGGLAQVVIGLGLGIALSAIVSPAMGELLFYTSPWDWTVYSLIALVLAVTGSLASIVPAARATRVDPMDTLRYE